MLSLFHFPPIVNFGHISHRWEMSEGGGGAIKRGASKEILAGVTD